MVDRGYVGGVLDWISPFSIFTGLGLIVAYALLGCTWLIIKTDGLLYDRMLSLARTLTLVLLAVIVIISIWTPLIHQSIADRWFSMPNLLWFAPVPLLVAVAAYYLLQMLHGRPQLGPFLLTLALIFLGYSGLGISVWPHIIPPDISIWEASGPPQSQGFALVGALLIIPIILMYTGWAYYIFRGKVRPGEGYH